MNGAKLIKGRWVFGGDGVIADGADRGGRQADRGDRSRRGALSPLPGGGGHRLGAQRGAAGIRQCAPPQPRGVHHPARPVGCPAGVVDPELRRPAQGTRPRGDPSERCGATAKRRDQRGRRAQRRRQRGRVRGERRRRTRGLRTGGNQGRLRDRDRNPEPARPRRRPGRSLRRPPPRRSAGRRPRPASRPGSRGRR